MSAIRSNSFRTHQYSEDEEYNKVIAVAKAAFTLIIARVDYSKALAAHFDGTITSDQLQATYEEYCRAVENVDVVCAIN